MEILYAIGSVTPTFEHFAVTHISAPSKVVLNVPWYRTDHRT